MLEEFTNSLLQSGRSGVSSLCVECPEVVAHMFFVNCVHRLKLSKQLCSSTHYERLTPSKFPSGMLSKSIRSSITSVTLKGALSFEC